MTSSLPTLAAAVVVVMSSLLQGGVQECVCVASPRVEATIGTAPPILIWEFYPAAVAGDEYVKLRSTADEDVSLRGWSLTDGEGTLELSSDSVICPGREISISFNSSSYTAAYGACPDFALDRPDLSAGIESTGSFRLSDSGDSLTLMDPDGQEVDSVFYGEVVITSSHWEGTAIDTPRAGEVFRRLSVDDAATDTDTSADWQPFREFRYGYTDHSPYEVEVAPGCLCAFVSPDCALDVILDRVDSAADGMLLCSYEIQSPTLCKHLLRALERDVKVEILVDGSPIGGMSSAQMASLSALAAAGADVRVVTGTLRDGVVRHFSALHSKYMVFDMEDVVVLSENFVGSGLPVDKVFGNRGWGVAVKSAELAGYLSGVFRDDSRDSRRDIIHWIDDERFDPSAEPHLDERTRHAVGLLSPLTCTSAAYVTLYVSPDSSKASPFICDVMDSARDVVVEQLQADLLWDTRWSTGGSASPLLSKLLGLLREGATCRMLLDSSWYNVERNEGVAAAMTAVSSVEGLEGSFRTMHEGSPITVLHNKGVVLDGAVTVVSSNNWVYASFARNREVAAVVQSSEVAGYFLRAFEMDWVPDVSPPVATLPTETVVRSGERALLSADGCSDDRLIADYVWDIGADGVVDGRGPELSFLALVPGAMEVSLTVVDAWGNSATATVTVRVVAEHLPDEGDGITPWDAAVAATPFCIVVSLLLARKTLSRRSKGRR